MTAGTRPLIVANDETVIDEVIRLAAAVGCLTERAPDLVAARTSWARAPMVILDEEAALRQHALPRRRGVFLVCKGAPAPSVWRSVFDAGVERVLSLPEDEAALLAELADVVDGPDVPGGRIIGFLGGRGGAGASVLTAAVAMTVCREGGSALLMDCDPLGGGIDIVLGAEAQCGLRWSELQVGSGRVSMSALREALPAREYHGGRLSFVSYDREGGGSSVEAVTAVAEAGRRAGRKVLCDLPRNLGRTTEAVVGLADLMVVVVPAEVRASIAAQRIQRYLEKRAARVALVVRGPSPDDIPAADIAATVGLPLLTWMPPERGLALALDRGKFELNPRGPLGVAARAVLRALPDDEVAA